MDIKQGKKAGKALARPTSNQFDKRGCKGEKYHPETFLLGHMFFSWLCLQYCHNHNHMQMGNALRNANVCSTQGTFCRTSDFNFNFDFNFFYLFSFFPLPLVFSNILNTLKITNHRKTFDHIIQYSKPHLIIRFK